MAGVGRGKTPLGHPDNLIRLAVGLEGLEDLKADMCRGLTALGFSE
jgi:cystathionine beta-lyase/cystathionine gamma-synthase